MFVKDTNTSTLEMKGTWGGREKMESSAGLKNTTICAHPMESWRGEGRNKRRTPQSSRHVRCLCTRTVSGLEDQEVSTGPSKSWFVSGGNFSCTAG